VLECYKRLRSENSVLIFKGVFKN